MDFYSLYFLCQDSVVMAAISRPGFEGWLCSVTLSKTLVLHFAHLVGGVVTAIRQPIVISQYVCEEAQYTIVLIILPSGSNNEDKSC